MALKVLIVDDERLSRKRVDDVLQALQNRCPTVSLGESDNAMDAWEMILEDKPDVVLLDIHMPGFNGLELAKKIRTLDMPPAIIFLTAFSDYAVTAFEVQAIDYVLKLIEESRLLAALMKVKPLAEKEHALTRCIEVYYVDTKQKALASVHDILMATADWRSTQLWTDGDFHYGCDSSLQRLEEEFPDIFLRIHRSTLVNRQCIEKMDQDTEGKWAVHLRGMEQPCFISRRLLATVKSSLIA